MAIANETHADANACTPRRGVLLLVQLRCSSSCVYVSGLCLLYSPQQYSTVSTMSIHNATSPTSTVEIQAACRFDIMKRVCCVWGQQKIYEEDRGHTAIVIRFFRLSACFDFDFDFRFSFLFICLFDCCSYDRATSERAQVSLGGPKRTLNPKTQGATIYVICLCQWCDDALPLSLSAMFVSE